MENLQKLIHQPEPLQSQNDFEKLNNYLIKMQDDVEFRLEILGERFMVEEITLNDLDELDYYLENMIESINGHIALTPQNEHLVLGMVTNLKRKVYVYLANKAVEGEFNFSGFEDYVFDSRANIINFLTKRFDNLFQQQEPEKKFFAYEKKEERKSLATNYVRALSQIIYELPEMIEDNLYSHELVGTVLNQLKDGSLENAPDSQISKILNLDVGFSSGELLKALKSTTNKDLKRKINSVLCYLEFGKIGISKEGVEYLEKKFDLGDYNNPDYHVSRLTPEGEIGVFNEEMELIKYFELSGLNSEEAVVRTQVLDITYETLFMEKENETQEEKEERMRYLAEFKKNYYKITEDKMFSASGIRINNLTFKEQGWFLIYFNKASEEEKEILREFAEKYKEDGIRSFLALENGFENGTKIISIAETIDRDNGLKIFTKLSSLTKYIEQKSGLLVKKLFYQKGQIDINQIKKELLARVDKIICTFSELVDVDDEKNSQLTAELMKELNQCQTEEDLLIAILSEFTKRGDKELEQIKELYFKMYFEDDEISSEEIDRIKAELEENWPESVEKQSIIESALNDLRNNEKRVYLLEYRGEIVAIMRFKRKEDGCLWAGSFVVDKDVRKLNIGEFVITKVLKHEAKKNVLTATVHPRAMLGEKYIEEVGFVVDGFVESYKGGDPRFSIRADLRQNEEKKFRNEGKAKQELIGVDEIVKEYGKNMGKTDDEILQMDSFVLKYDLENEYEKYLARMKNIFSQKTHIITRMISREEDDKEYRYLMFEKIN